MFPVHPISFQDSILKILSLKPCLETSEITIKLKHNLYFRPVNIFPNFWQLLVITSWFMVCYISLYTPWLFHRYWGQCLPFYIINEVGHLTTSVDHLAEFCQNYHLAAICTQLMVKFFLQLRFIQYFDCKCMKIPDFSRIDSHFVA